MRVKIIAVFLLLLFIFPNNVRAECDNTRLSDLSSIAGNVRLSTTYRLVDNYPIFTVEISNITDDIYLVDGDGTVFTKTSNVKDYYHFQSPSYVIYSNDPNCYGFKLLDRSISIPHYNTYSLLDVCKNSPGDSLCSLWGYSGFATEEEFLKAFNEKHSTNTLVIDDEIEETTSSSNVYLIVLVTAIVLTFGIVVLFVVRRKKK
ncbi:MAG: hypothetical protein IKF82_08315 [Bacilli bacterium]|nr:hypothetical protein [Bacilli bacterium]